MVFDAYRLLAVPRKTKLIFFKLLDPLNSLSLNYKSVAVQDFVCNKNVYRFYYAQTVKGL